ncbi:MAG: hypothetical protein JNL11_14985 [Bdellovibrionaceae bacterium]|nr:hypothetical protein [Pseudobdellovibrionaceae bacterium]
MKVNLKTKCPCCGSKEIHTLGFDQFCLTCDWINALDLVVTGQFDEELEALESSKELQTETSIDSNRINEPQAQSRTA